MHDEQTVLLIDNEDQLLAESKILAQLMTELTRFKGCVLATADFASGMFLMDAVGIDLVVIAGNSRSTFLYKRILSLQLQFSDIVVIALTDSNEPAILNRILRATGCHRCLSVASDDKYLAKVICMETEKVATEKRLIAKMLASEQPRRQSRVLVQPVTDFELSGFSACQTGRP
jgi:hypothetical protein